MNIESDTDFLTDHSLFRSSLFWKVIAFFFSLNGFIFLFFPYGLTHALKSCFHSEFVFVQFYYPDQELTEMYFSIA